MKKATVINTYTDRETLVRHFAGDVVDLSAERLEELVEKGKVVEGAKEKVVQKPESKKSDAGPDKKPVVKKGVSK